MALRSVLLPLAVLLGVSALVAWTASARVPMAAPSFQSSDRADMRPTIERVDRRLEDAWETAGVVPADPADELHVLRRLSLVLHGTIPSLEEIRRFEADRQPDRLLRWTAAMLDDPRFADYFAERLARGLVGTDFGQFIIFRRDRLTDWLAVQLAGNRPYDELVRDLIAAEGLWTGEPATNFVTAAVTDGDIDENKLASRTVRAFLGQRIDCAQCHDHPFDDWKQGDFEGLAAFFGQAQVSLAGVEDVAMSRREPVEYVIEEMASQPRLVPPRVPFAAERLPAGGTRRQQLAAWVTHPDNRRFDRATVNRVWTLLFGRPATWPDSEVDNLPDPPDRRTEFHSGRVHGSDVAAIERDRGRSRIPFYETTLSDDLLDVLADDFRQHGCDLKRLILTITATRAFRLSTRHPAANDDDLQDAERAWAVFPVTRLRPEQLIGSMLQASSVGTIDRNSHLIVRIRRYFGERDFVQEYGDLGENELEEQSGTVPQALLRMNGNLVRELTRAQFLNASGRIAAVAQDPERCVETAYLVCLTRRPMSAELEAFAPQLGGEDQDERRQAVEDLFWALFNLEEFAWQH